LAHLPWHNNGAGQWMGGSSLSLWHSDRTSIYFRHRKSEKGLQTQRNGRKNICKGEIGIETHDLEIFSGKPIERHISLKFAFD